MLVESENERAGWRNSDDGKVQPECDSGPSALREKDVPPAALMFARRRLAVFARAVPRTRGRSGSWSDFGSHAAELAKADDGRDGTDQEREDDCGSGSPNHCTRMITLQLFFPTYDSGFFWNLTFSSSEQK